jgi:hypothetical protein
LPNLDANFTLCFENFVDAVIDLLIPGQSPGIKEKIVDLSGRKDPEVLFFGPDENTAGLMDWACFHARKRNAPWWKVSLACRLMTEWHTDVGLRSYVVVHHRKERFGSRWYPSRRLRHDLVVRPTISARSLPNPRSYREERHQGSDRRPRR